MKITKLKTSLGDTAWHVAYKCPACGHHRERRLSSQESADELWDEHESGAHRCNTCTTVDEGHGTELRSMQAQRHGKGSYAEKLRRDAAASRARAK